MLRRLGGEITALAISHQPAVVEVADVVYWMRDGQTERAYSRSAAAAG
jgi:ABC-type glutathione transport system ATPase component